MKHNVKISVSNKPMRGGIIACHRKTVRERIMRFLFGEKQHMTIIIPGDTVEEIAVKEVGGQVV